jgi:putative flippase GtrA
MLIFNAVAVIVAYVLIATWSYKRGRRMLVKSALGFLAVLLVAAGVLGQLLDVPSTSNLIFYVLVQGAPIIIVPTWLLLLLYSNRGRQNNESPIGPLPVAVVGAAVGFVMGYLFAILAFPATP